MPTARGVIPALYLGVLLAPGRASCYHEEPYVTFDAFWNGGGASSCKWNGASAESFFANCSLTATGKEVGHGQPRTYSTGTDRLMFTRCSASSTNCDVKDLCLSRAGQGMNRSVELEGCIRGIRIDSQVASEWGKSGSVAWRGLVKRGEAGKDDTHNICVANSFLDGIFDLARCIHVPGNDADLDNVALGLITKHFSGAQEEVVAFSQLFAGRHFPCYFNSTNPTPGRPHCIPAGFDPNRMIFAEGGTRLVIILNDTICSYRSDLSGGAHCLRLKPGQYPVSNFTTDANTKSAVWLVWSDSFATRTMICTAPLLVGSGQATCVGFPGAPAGKTVLASAPAHGYPGEWGITVNAHIPFHHVYTCTYSGGCSKANGRFVDLFYLPGPGFALMKSGDSASGEGQGDDYSWCPSLDATDCVPDMGSLLHLDSFRGGGVGA